MGDEGVSPLDECMGWREIISEPTLRDEHQHGPVGFCAAAGMLRRHRGCSIQLLLRRGGAEGATAAAGVFLEKVEHDSQKGREQLRLPVQGGRERISHGTCDPTKDGANGVPDVQNGELGCCRSVRNAAGSGTLGDVLCHTWRIVKRYRRHMVLPCGMGGESAAESNVDVHIPLGDFHGRYWHRCLGLFGGTG